MRSRRKICVVTGTRAEYGLLRHLMKLIARSEDLDLQIVVTGSHLVERFGATYQEIGDDGFTIDHKVDIELIDDTPVGISRSTGLGVTRFAEVFEALSPDLLLILGDRFEVLSAAIPAMLARIPIAHLHGGELTEGAVDEAIRHSITKLSHLHFVANDEYRNRVIQLGEQPSSVFMVGGLGVDAIGKIRLWEREELESNLGFRFLKRNLLVTFHPVTLENKSSAEQMTQLLNALDSLEDTRLIFTMPNADADHHAIYEMIEQFVSSRANAVVFASLGQVRYLSCLRQVDGVIGNSSSGLAEVPSFKKGTVNIGDRQKGRLMAASVINCDPTRESIEAAIHRLYSAEFQKSLATVTNPYGDGGAAEKILKVLEQTDFSNLIRKKFFDLART